MSERKIEWVNQETLAKITGKDRRTVKGRLAGMHFKQEGRQKLYDKMIAVQAIVTKSADPESDAKNRRAVADAEKAEIIVARLRGELVPVADMKTAAAELIKTLYARIVRVTPSILAPTLLGKTDPLEIEAVLRTALADAFDELKSMPEHFLSIDPTDDIEEILDLPADTEETDGD
jgi:hypothetical protein